jgi:uncharacterized Zn finger protein (UPF0148 family)
MIDINNIPKDYNPCPVCGYDHAYEAEAAEASHQVEEEERHSFRTKQHVRYKREFQRSR